MFVNRCGLLFTDKRCNKQEMTGLRLVEVRDEQIDRPKLKPGLDEQLGFRPLAVLFERVVRDAFQASRCRGPDADNPATCGAGSLDALRSLIRDCEPFVRHRVIVAIPNRLKARRADVQCQRAGVDTPRFELLEQSRGEMEPRRRRSDRTRASSENRLIKVAVEALSPSVSDITRNRHAAIILNSLTKRDGASSEGQLEYDPIAGLVPTDDGCRDPFAELDFVAGSELSHRPSERLPNFGAAGLRISALEEQYLDLGSAVTNEKPARHDPTVIEHEQVSFPQQRRKSKELAVLNAQPLWRPARIEEL